VLYGFNDQWGLFKIDSSGLFWQIAPPGGSSDTASGVPPSQVHLFDVHALTFDSQGRLYLCDNTTVRRIDFAANTITTLAGTSTTGFGGDGGPATSAVLNIPAGLAVDSVGDLFIADFGNNRVREITDDGSIHTIAGTGALSNTGDGGPASSAAVLAPWNLVIDHADSLDISENPNTQLGYSGVIRRISPAASTGIISTIVGTGTNGWTPDGSTGTQTQLGGVVEGMGINPAGELVFNDINNNYVRRLATSGSVNTLFGSGTSKAGSAGDGGPARLATTDYPNELAVDSTGDLAFGDTQSGNLRRVALGANGFVPAGGVPGADENPNNHQPSENSPCAHGCYGDPVDTATGDFTQTATDFAIPGRGPALNLNRTYQSAFASRNGRYGFGWSDSYSLSLSIDTSASPTTATLTQEDGSQIIFTEGGDGFTAPPRILATLTANEDGTYTMARRAKQLFTFDATGRLVSEADLNGYQTTLAYNSAGQLTSVTDPAQRQLTLSYNSAGQVDTATDPSGRTVQYGYDGSGNLTTVTDPTNATTQYGYDDQHRMVTVLDPNQATASPQHPLTNVYDAIDRVSRQTDYAGRVTTFDYTTFPGDTKITDPNGNVTLDIYADGLRWEHITGYGTSSQATWSYDYDPVTMQAASVTDPNGHTTTYAYDSRGNLASQTDALGHSTTYSYDSLNDQTSAKDANGVTTTRTYDAAGNLLTTSTPLDGTSQTATTTDTYADVAHPGDVTATTDPDSKTTQYSYDQYGQLSAVTDPVGAITTYNYTCAAGPGCYPNTGLIYSQVSPRGNAAGADPAQFTTTFIYDADGRRTSTTAPRAKVTGESYDADGNRISATDPNNHTTTYGYDLDNELTNVSKPDHTNQTFGYDGDGNQTRQTDGRNNSTTYAFTDPALPTAPTSTTNADSQTTTYSYDGAGNVSAVGGARTVEYYYDADNRVIKIDFPNAQNFCCNAENRYSYDNDGQRVSMTSYSSVTASTYVWDSLHRLTSSTNSAGQNVQYGYDLAGHLTSITYPNGKTVSRGYDDAGHLTSVSDWSNNTTRFSYDPSGNITEQDAPNGVNTALTYDVNNAVTDITSTRAGAPVVGFSYTRDSDELVTSETSNGVQQAPQTYTYTTNNQLASAGSTTYTYDAAGNLTQAGNKSLGYTAGDELDNASYSASGSQTHAPLGLPNEVSAGYQWQDSANPSFAGSDLTTAYGQWAQLSAGASHSLALSTDGYPSAWGSDSSGQLGDNATTTEKGPSSGPALTGITQIVAGRGSSFSLAVKKDGTVWAWGANSSGQLGNNSTTTSKVPVQVPGLTNVIAIAAGASHALALKSDGTVWAWGLNASGQLGIGSTTTSKAPVQVHTLTDVTAIAAGASHSLAISSDGTVWAWGLNSSGQLGNNSTTNATAPVQVSIPSVIALAGGTSHTLALKSDGTVWAWGANTSGQLGNNSTTTSKTPVQVTGLSGVASIAAGASHSLALKSDGTVWSWGLNSSGQLGNGTTTTSKTPVQVTSFGERVVAVAAGDNFSLAFTQDGAHWGWGADNSGQLGQGNTTAYNVPTYTGTGMTNPGTFATYAYDGDGLRSRKNAGGTQLSWSWDVAEGSPQLLTDGNYNFIYGPDGLPIEQIDAAGNATYFHHDQQGSTRALSDQTGTVVATYNYDPYGSVTSQTGSVGTPLLYDAQYYDAETGLYYMRARSYDPATTQFVSRDPLGIRALSPYAFGNDNPLTSGDPTGLAPCDVGGREESHDGLIINCQDITGDPRDPVRVIKFSIYAEAAPYLGCYGKWSVATSHPDFDPSTAGLGSGAAMYGPAVSFTVPGEPLQIDAKVNVYDYETDQVIATYSGDWTVYVNGG